MIKYKYIILYLLIIIDKIIESAIDKSTTSILAKAKKKMSERVASSLLCLSVSIILIWNLENNNESITIF